MIGSRMLRYVGALLLGLLPVMALALDAQLKIRTSGQEANLVKFDPKNPSAPGLSMEVIKALMRIDPGLVFSGQEELRSLRRISDGLATGELDVFFGLIPNQFRMTQFLVITQPVLYTQSSQIAVTADDNIDIQSLDDVRKLGPKGVIGVPQGSAQVDFLNAQGGLTVDDGTYSVSATLKKLLAGRVRFVYYGGSALSKQVKEDGLETRVKVLPKRFTTETLCVMLSRKTSPEIVSRIQLGLNTLQRNGELDQLRVKYGVQAP